MPGNRFFVAGGRDWRTPAEKLVDRYVEDHREGEHDGIVLLDCPLCDEESES